uniref:Uncharacterized protein n=1 Tax=Caenorhabditis japonica TaxID=281687 RepID=A0A8R1E3C3_CAEJA
MQAKLFMIPWLFVFARAQRVTNAVVSPPAQTLTNDLLVNAHHRHFYEMIRRQQQINDALLLNNALLHPHIPQLPIPANDPILTHPPLFNPFVPQTQSEGSTSKLGTYGRADSDETTQKKLAPSAKTEEKPYHNENPDEKEGTVEAPYREADFVKKSLAGVKTVSIQRKGEVATSTLSPEDLEVVQLFKKLNLSKEETKSIVEKVEQVVREKVIQKFKQENATSTTTTTVQPSTTPVTITTTTITTTTKPSTTVEDLIEELEEMSTTSHKPPKLHVRTEENLILQRHNLKHHPIKIQSKKLPEIVIPIQSSEEISQGSIKTSLTHLPIIVANEEEDVTMPKRILIASQNPKKENDRDLLVDFATGAPLELTEPEVPKINSAATTVITSTLPPVTGTFLPVLPPRQTHPRYNNNKILILLKP